jgi:hypothetical protein
MFVVVLIAPALGQFFFAHRVSNYYNQLVTTMKTILVFCLLASAHSFLFAQNSIDIETAPHEENSMGRQGRNFVIQENTFKHRYDDYYDNLIEEYEERMIANAKKYKKMARIMSKPQYADPSYFGHKRKPKKRAVGKRKYCKECEIVH